MENLLIEKTDFRLKVYIFFFFFFFQTKQINGKKKDFLTVTEPALVTFFPCYHFFGSVEPCTRDGESGPGQDAQAYKLKACLGAVLHSVCYGSAVSQSLAALSAATATVSVSRRKVRCWGRWSMLAAGLPPWRWHRQLALAWIRKVCISISSQVLKDVLFQV